MGDSALNSLKRGAEELGIDLIDVRTENDERELIEYCGLPNTLATRGTLRRKIRELQRPPVYQVTARVLNALNSHGARGNVYKLLEKYGARYSAAESKQVVYDGDDLTDINESFVRDWAKQYGGASVQPVAGIWYDDNGNKYAEPCDRVIIAAKGSSWNDNSFRLAAKQYAAIAGQLAMYLVTSQGVEILDTAADIAA